MKIEIKDAHIIDPSIGINEICNLYIQDHNIAAIKDPPEGWNADHTIDAQAHYLIPGIVDIATRLREPGQEHKATIESETRAAVSAGITSVVCQPDTNPVVNTPAEVELILQKNNSANHCHVYVIGALTQNLSGNILTEMAALKEAGVVGVSNCHQPLANNLVLRRAMEYASGQELTLFIHPIDHALSGQGCIHEGMTATRMGLTGIPNAAETAAVGAILALIEQTNVRVHFCRISTQRSLQLLERAKFDGAPISADMCAHQLFFSDQDIKSFDSNYHVIPPFRSQVDVIGLRKRLSNELISSICSDHQPHDADSKLAPFPSTEPGISSLETLLPLVLRLVHDEVITLSMAISLLTYKPAQLLNINAGSLAAGMPADICIFNPDLEWELTHANIVSHGKNTPFLNQTFKGKVTHTLVNGKIVYQT
ncbi:MAG: dihydroorotase [Pseudomonadota bacterium]